MSKNKILINNTPERVERRKRDADAYYSAEPKEKASFERLLKAAENADAETQSALAEYAIWRATLVGAGMNYRAAMRDAAATEVHFRGEGYRVLDRVLGEISKQYFRTMSHYLNNDEALLVAWLIARTDDGKPFNYVQIGERMGGISSTTVMNRRNKLMGKNKEVEDFLNRILPRPPRGTRNG
tara:strand:+ start:327 stop:875 length:549 start_codon:yes stop_codon:yes gene_type:complete